MKFSVNCICSLRFRTIQGFAAYVWTPEMRMNSMILHWFRCAVEQPWQENPKIISGWIWPDQYRILSTFYRWFRIFWTIIASICYMIVESIQKCSNSLKAYEDLENSSHAPIDLMCFSAARWIVATNSHMKKVLDFSPCRFSHVRKFGYEWTFWIIPITNINRSLVYSAISLNLGCNRRVIPYRNSQLSVLLQNSLGRDSSYICLFLFSDGSNLSNEENAENKGKDFFLQTWLEKSHFKILCWYYWRLLLFASGVLKMSNFYGNRQKNPGANFVSLDMRMKSIAITTQVVQVE